MCPASIKEFVESARHRGYLADHSGEFPFPIDGSEWSRLISTRISHEHHLEHDAHHNPDFWVWLHGNNGPLRHERRVYQRAMHHWFLLGNDTYLLPWYHSGEQSQKELIWQSLYEYIRKQKKTNLAEFETDWVNGETAAKVWLPKSGEHWLGGDSEQFETRPTPNMRHLDVDGSVTSFMSTKGEGRVPCIGMEDLDAVPVVKDDEIIYLPDTGNDIEKLDAQL